MCFLVSSVYKSKKQSGTQKTTHRQVLETKLYFAFSTFQKEKERKFFTRAVFHLLSRP